MPGVKLRLGEVLVEITDYATPCRTIRHAFVNEEYGRVSETRNPGWARTYARVLQPGQLYLGDVVRIE